MAVPFRKVSKTRKNMRRAHDAISATGTMTCPNCKAIIQPHRVCDECGYYKGKNRIKKEEAA